TFLWTRTMAFTSPAGRCKPRWWRCCAKLQAASSKQPVNDVSLDPADAAVAIVTQENKMPAALADLHTRPGRRAQVLEGRHRHERIIAGGDDEGRVSNPRDQRERRGSVVIVHRIGKAAARGRKQIIKLADAGSTRKFRERRIGVELLPLPGQADE